MELIGIILSAIFISNSITCFIEWGINKIKISNKYKKKGIDNQIMLHIKDSNGNEMSSEASIDGKHNLQIVYKIDGDFTGDIKGDNIIVILMNGDVNGDISSKEGDVVLIKGNINGDVKANKVICQQPKSDYENYIDKLSNIDKLSKPDKENGEKHCPRFIDKDGVMKKIKESPTQPPPDYVNCADCAYGEEYNTTPNGYEYYKYYKCSKFDGVMRFEGARICDLFKQKERHICKNCYHFVKGINESYCSKHTLDKLYDSVTYCSLYDSIGETTNYK